MALPSLKKCTLPAGQEYEFHSTRHTGRFYVFSTKGPGPRTLYAANDEEDGVLCALVLTMGVTGAKLSPGASEGDDELRGQWAAGYLSPPVHPGTVVPILTCDNWSQLQCSWRPAQRPIAGRGPKLPAGVTVAKTDSAGSKEVIYLVTGSDGVRYIYNDSLDGPTSASIYVLGDTNGTPTLGPGAVKDETKGWTHTWVLPPIMPQDTVHGITFHGGFDGQIKSMAIHPAHYHGDLSGSPSVVPAAANTNGDAGAAAEGFDFDSCTGALFATDLDAVQRGITASAKTAGRGAPAGAVFLQCPAVRGTVAKLIPVAMEDQAAIAAQAAFLADPKHANDAFQDASFPGTAAMLGEGNVAKKFAAAGSQITFARATAHLAPQVVAKTPPRAIERAHPNDIGQGQIGDCWFVSALSAVAEFPERIERLFPVVSDPALLLRPLLAEGSTATPVTQRAIRAVEGTLKGEPGALRKSAEAMAIATGLRGAHVVRMCFGGLWRCVVLDDVVACRNCVPDFVRNRKDAYELWPTLVEKAFAKLSGSYSHIEGSAGIHESAHTLLTGFPSVLLGDRWVAAQKDAGKAASLFGALQRYDQLDYTVTIWSSNLPTLAAEGITASHGFSLLRVVRHGPHRLLHIRNPWGNEKEWNGAWSDKSDLWAKHPDVAAVCGFTGPASDGAFWMTFEDALPRFSNGRFNLYRDGWFDFRFALYPAPSSPAVHCALGHFALRLEVVDVAELRGKKATTFDSVDIIATVVVACDSTAQYGDLPPLGVALYEEKKAKSSARGAPLRAKWVAQCSSWAEPGAPLRPDKTTLALMSRRNSSSVNATIQKGKVALLLPFSSATSFSGGVPLGFGFLSSVPCLREGEEPPLEATGLALRATVQHFPRAALAPGVDTFPEDIAVSCGPAPEGSVEWQRLVRSEMSYGTTSSLA